MKNLKLILIALLFITLQSSAQDGGSDYKTFRFGIAVQPNLSWMKIDSKDFESNGISGKFSYGLMAEYAFAQNYAFASGIQILTTGGRVNYKSQTYFEEDGKIDITNNSNFLLGKRTYGTQYLNIPLTLKMRTNEIGYMTYFAQFGMDAGFKTNAKGKDTGTDNVSVSANPQTPGNTKTVHNINRDVNFFRLAMNIGGGAEYNLSGTTSLVFGINYSNGFVNVLKKNSDQIKTVNVNANANAIALNKLSQNARTHYIGLTAGILF